MTDPSVSLGVARLRALIEKWRDQGRIYAAMKHHPTREWFNGNGEALKLCADQVEKLMAALPAADPRLRIKY